MEVIRCRVIEENGDISFIKIIATHDEIFTEVLATYSIELQTELDFSAQAQKMFDEAFPEWAGVIVWPIVTEEDFEDLYLDLIG